MKITVISVGKIKEKYLKDAIAEYSKRLAATVSWRSLRYRMKKLRIRQAKRWKADSG
mgnify:CR=1 FL=1